MESTMVKTHAKRGRTKYVAFIVALAVLSVGLLAGLLAVFAESNKQKIFLENHYEEIAYELNDSVRTLEMNLSKLMVSNSPAENLSITLDTYRQAEIAVTAITSLPVSYFNVEEATQFLNQVADWSRTMHYRLAHKLNTAKLEGMAEDFYAVARAVNMDVSEFVALLGKNNFKIITHVDPNPPKGKSFELKGNSVEYPEMIYDGPFSDGTTPKAYKALENLIDISFDEAVEGMQKAMGGEPFKDVKNLGVSEGDAPAYEFLATTELGETYFSVSVKGGVTLNMNASRDIGKTMLGENEAKKAAVELAAKFGFDVQPVWYNEQDGVAYVNLAPIKNEIVYYTDLVKVKVGLDNGGLMGLEASGYAMNHHARAENAKITKSDVLKIIFAGLKPYESRLCVVPSEEQGEVFCWEIAADYKGLDYFVYINAVSGEQVRILRVIDEGQGKLTI